MADSPTRRLKRKLAAAVTSLWRRPKISPEELRALRPVRILLVRQHNQMGDMVCALPALRALQETWPAAELHLVTSPVNGAVVRDLPYLAGMLTFSQRMWRRPWALLRFVRAMRRLRCEVAFVLGSVSFSVTSAAIALVSGARWIVGPDSRPYGWDLSHNLFALELPASPVVDRPAVEHNLAPLQAVGIDTADHEPRLDPGAESQARARQIMADLGLEDGFWALHPGAGKCQNVWPADRFAAVAERAVAAGHGVLVMHGPADGPALTALKAALGQANSSGVVFAPLLEVAVCSALLARCGRFLGNDTGMMHVAGAVGTPTVALFGPTDPALWKPPSPRVIALRSSRRTPDDRGEEFGWMENLSIEEVWEAWRDLAPATRTMERDA